MAPSLVLRLGRRMTTWEREDAREVAELLFPDSKTGGLDLKPSVYVLADRSSVTRARAEHSASFFVHAPKPTQSTVEWDLTGATTAVPQASPGTTRFTFTQSAHAELVLSETEVVALAARLLAERRERAIEVSMHEVLEYIDARLTQNDPEWIAHIGSLDERAGAWGKAILAFRRKQPPRAG